MKKILSVVCGLTLLFGACANNEAPGVEDKAEPEVAKSAADSLVDKSSEEVASGTETEDSAELIENDAMKKRLAKRRAQNHLALKQVSWGEPESITEDEESFYVHYETPKRELRLIGQRTLIVDKESGLVTYQKRR